jgi:carbonic anhydrase/acetyltransferase-like protein (isoleucine patch superfamily)
LVASAGIGRPEAAGKRGIVILPFGNHQPALGKGVYIAPSADVIGRVTLGHDASVFFQCVLRADINTITVGAKTNIQDHTTVHLASDLGTVIGAEVSIGHGCIIHACTIGNRILVGMGSIIMDGAEIGDECLVGAGTLIPKGKRFESGTLILGNPAKALRKLTQEERDGIAKLADKYVMVKDAYLQSRAWPG